MKHLELLAPARDINIGIAAIDCGADAVYIAGPSFGARQAAGNSVEDIRQLCEYAHRFGAKIFVTLNTIIYDNELEDAFSLALSLQDAGADALIVQDLSLLSLREEGRLTIPLHASTQCSIQDVPKARLLESLGFSRLVLERQLSLSEIREICNACTTEIECFVHGALCVSYSGQCYLSEMLCGRSANRGGCSQPCRSRYELVDGDGRLITDSKGRPLAKGKTLLSLKDLNLYDRLEDLADAGVTSFKIEGRLKNISYVRNVVSAYSQALDAIVRKHPESYDRLSFGRCDWGFKPKLEKTFNRFYTSINIDGERGHWACLDAGKSLGEPVASVVSISLLRSGEVQDKRNFSGRDNWSVGGRDSGRDGGRDSGREGRRDGGRDSCGQSRVILKALPGRDDIPVLHNGDGFSFISANGEDCGFRADICEENILLCSATEAISNLRPGTVLYRNLDTEFEKEVSKASVRSLAVNVRISFHSCSEDKDKSQTEQSEWKIYISAISEDGRNVEFEENISAETASNIERMESLLLSQISKSSGIYSFCLDEIISHEAYLPLLRTAYINGLRRKIADMLDLLPVKHKSLLNSSVNQLKQAASQSNRLIPQNLNYKFDIANKVSEAVWKGLGADKIEPAYELVHNDDAELMRSKYCIKWELGLCPKQRNNSANLSVKPANTSVKEDASFPIHQRLFLRNNGSLLELRFDCKRCEMTVHKATTL